MNNFFIVSISLEEGVVQLSFRGFRREILPVING